MAAPGQDGEARLKELRTAYDRLRRRVDESAATEREAARNAAASAKSLTQVIRRGLSNVESQEARERAMVEAWESDARRSVAPGRHHGLTPPSHLRSPVPTARSLALRDGTASERTGTYADSDASVEVRSETDDGYDDGPLGVSANLPPTMHRRQGSGCDSAARSPVPGLAGTNIANPNVLGDPVGGQSNRQWYLCESVRRTLLLHAGLAMADTHNDPSSGGGGLTSPNAAAPPAATAAADDEDSDEAELHRDDWRSGSITDAAVAGLQRREETPKKKKKTSAFSALKATLNAKRQRRVEATQEPKYHCHLERGSVAAEVGMDAAGRLGPLKKDALTSHLKERFGIADDTDDGDEPDEALARTDRSTSSTPGFNSFERIYGKTALAATTAASADDSSARVKGAPRLDELVLTFHSEVHLTRVRRGLDISVDDIRASCGSRCASWRVGSSAGKSDSMFLYFGHYVAKSVSESEFKFLTTEYLPAFAAYSDRAPYTLLPHFSFLFTVTWLASRRTMRFVVMNNVFRTTHFITRMYDLKGSTVGRDGVDAKSGEATVRTGFGAVLLKDNDTPNRLMVLGPMRRAMLVAQVQSDTAFLQRLNVVDYSLLVGQRSRSISTADASAASLMGTRNGSNTGSGVVGGQHRRSQSHGDPNHAGYSSAGSPLTAGAMGISHRRTASAQTADSGPGYNPVAADQLDGRCFRSSDGGLVSLPVHESASGSDAREDTFYVGLIDVLQQYSGAKKLENMAKSIFYDGSKISVVPPADFAQRLCILVERVTV
jgi:hypothetical protein